MTIYAQPGATFEAGAVLDAPGLTGTVGVQIIDPATMAVLSPRQTAGISEQPASSGIYFVSLTAPLVPDAYAVVWDTGLGGEWTAEDLFVGAFVGPYPPTLGLPGASTGPCALWVSPDDVPCGSSDVDSITPFIVIASELLYELSARQFGGSCEATVRPCRSACACWTDQRWADAWRGGEWRYGGGGECGCGCEQSVTLAGYPVTDISEVTIDGAIVASTSYELREQRHLFRVSPEGDAAWPACQDLNRPLGEAGTWSVRYLHGIAPPLAGVHAARQLACELWLAENDAEACQLPSGVTQIVRQGVTVSMLAPLFAHGQRTGLILVDAFLATYNPSGLRRRPAIHSPGYPRFPRRAT